MQAHSWKAFDTVSAQSKDYFETSQQDSVEIKQWKNQKWFQILADS